MLKSISLLLVLAGVCSQATAAITISDFTITQTGLSFKISGTMPSTSQTISSPNFLLLVNQNAEGSSLNAIPNIINTSSAFSGSQTLLGTQTGDTNFGDYLRIVFSEALTHDAGLVGTLSATWDAAIFDPTMIGKVDLYWGVDPVSQSITSGIHLASVTAVPEPATYAAVGGFAILALVAARSLRRKA